jgi:hypothetical protein
VLETPSFDCLLGVWLVENESLKNRANDVLGLAGTQLTITNVTGSVLYAFYKESPDNPSSGYRMNTVGNNIHITSTHGSDTFDIWVDYALVADISSSGLRQISCQANVRESVINITKVVVNGQTIAGGIDFAGDLIYMCGSRVLGYECPVDNRISLQSISSGGGPFYLDATTQTIN